MPSYNLCLLGGISSTKGSFPSASNYTSEASGGSCTLDLDITNVALWLLSYGGSEFEHTTSITTYCAIASGALPSELGIGYGGSDCEYVPQCCF